MKRNGMKISQLAYAKAYRAVRDNTCLQDVYSDNPYKLQAKRRQWNDFARHLWTKYKQH